MRCPLRKSISIAKVMGEGPFGIPEIGCLLVLKRLSSMSTPIELRTASKNVVRDADKSGRSPCVFSSDFTSSIREKCAASRFG